MDRRKLAAAASLVVLAVVVMLGLVACGGLASAETPPLQGATLQGEQFDLSADAGKPTVVNFFASWCPPCNAEAGDLVAVAEAHPEVLFVGVATGDEESGTRRFVDEHRIPYAVVLDPNGKLASAWGVDGIPATFFLDAQGQQQATLVGAASRDVFEEKLKSIK